MTYEEFIDRYWLPFVGNPPVASQETYVRQLLQIETAYLARYGGRGGGKSTLRRVLVAYYEDAERRDEVFPASGP